MAKNKGDAGSFSGSEKRRSRRLPVLESFSLSVVAVDRPDVRLPIHDLSEVGIGFDADMSADESLQSPMAAGDKLNLHIYLNRSLYIPVTVKIAHISQQGQIRVVGAEFHEKSKALKAVIQFVRFLDAASETGVIKKK